MGRRSAVLRAQIGDLFDDDDVDLLVEAPPWIIVARAVYEMALVGAAVLAGWLILEEGPMASRLGWVIWAWFATDYLVRVGVADDRADFVRRHRIELIAALPLDVFRPFRLLRLLRPLAILARATKGLRDVLGLLSALTGEVAQRLVTAREGAVSSGDPDIDHVGARLADWSSPDHAERRRLAAVLHALAVDVAASTVQVEAQPGARPVDPDPRRPH